MENVSQLTDAELVAKFKDLKSVFEQNLNDKNLRDSLNGQLGVLVVEMKKRNLQNSNV